MNYENHMGSKPFGDANGIVPVCLAFVSGIIAAEMLLSAGAGTPGLKMILAGSGAAAAASCMIVSALKKGSCRLWIILLYVNAGLMCSCSYALGTARPDGHAVRIASEALESFKALIDRCAFEGEGTKGLVKALLTGCRDELGKETIRNFRKSGASHILALSGLHLGVIYAILSKSLSFTGNSPIARTMRSSLIICCCGFYTVMTGASDSTVRAFIFILLNETARSGSGRERNPMGTLCTALTIQLALKPSGIQSAGFEMSYLAMFGILTIYPRLESWYPSSGKQAIDKADPMHRIWSSMALSISCQIFTAPVAWWHFQSFPMHFLLTNLIALPLTELLITAAVSAIALTAVDLCPDILPEITDSLAEALDFCMEAVATM